MNGVLITEEPREFPLTVLYCLVLVFLFFGWRFCKLVLLIELGKITEIDCSNL